MLALAALAALFTTTLWAAESYDKAYEPTVPFMLPAGDPSGQSIVRLSNQTNEVATLRITAVDDSANVYEPSTIEIQALESLSFNSRDLAYGNAAKGIVGIGAPAEGHLRLSVEAYYMDNPLGVKIQHHIRAPDGLLTMVGNTAPMDLLTGVEPYIRHESSIPELRESILVGTFNPASNVEHQSKLRIINWGLRDRWLLIRGQDDEGRAYGGDPSRRGIPGVGEDTMTVTPDGKEPNDYWEIGDAAVLRLGPGQSYMLSSVDLERGGDLREEIRNAHGLVPRVMVKADPYGLFWGLGDGVGGWTLRIGALGHYPRCLGPCGRIGYAGTSVNIMTIWGGFWRPEKLAVQHLVYDASGHITDLSTGTNHSVLPAPDHHSDSWEDASELPIDGQRQGLLHDHHDADWFRISLDEPLGTLTVYTTGRTSTVGNLYVVRPYQVGTGDKAYLQRRYDGGEGYNFWMEFDTRQPLPGLDEYESYGDVYLLEVKAGHLPRSTDAAGNRLGFPYGEYTVHAEFTAAMDDTDDTDTVTPPVVEGLDDDHGDCSNPTDLVLGGQESGNIEDAQDVVEAEMDSDCFKIVVTEPGTLTVYATTDRDYFYLQAELWRLLGDYFDFIDWIWPDERLGRDSFRFERDVEADTYYVEVMSAYIGGSGAYTIHAEFTPD